MPHCDLQMVEKHPLGEKYKSHVYNLYAMEHYILATGWIFNVLKTESLDHGVNNDHVHAGSFCSQV